eukprot:1571963-Rhodomonas_salina.1
MLRVVGAGGQVSDMLEERKGSEQALDQYKEQLDQQVQEAEAALREQRAQCEQLQVASALSRRPRSAMPGAEVQPAVQTQCQHTQVQLEASEENVAA